MITFLLKYRERIILSQSDMIFMWVAGHFQRPRKLFDSIETRTNYLDSGFFLIFAQASSIQKMKTFLSYDIQILLY